MGVTMGRREFHLFRGNNWVQILSVCVIPGNNWVRILGGVSQFAFCYFACVSFIPGNRWVQILG